MPTMVDAWGVSAHCDVCSAEADENDLEDDSAGRMACGRCRMDDLDHGPAVRYRCAGHKNPEFDYPERFGGKVPKTVRMLKNVKTDLLIGLAKGRPLEASAGNEFPAWTNSHGAVSAILPNGEKLGLFPSEFEVVEWLVSQETPDLGHNEVCGTSANDKEGQADG